MNTTDGLVTIHDARALLDTVPELNDFARFPTAMERNVTTAESTVLRNVRNICSPRVFSRDNFRSFSIDRVATIPFFKSGSCWNEMVDDMQSVCDHLAFRPDGDPTSTHPDQARELPKTWGNRPWGSRETIAITAFDATNFPPPQLQSRLPASGGNSYVVELFSEPERSTWNSQNAHQICTAEARVAFDEASGPHKVWGGVIQPYADLGPQIFREVSTGTPFNLMVRSCRLCDAFAFNQPITVSNQPSSKRLVFAPDMLIPIGGSEYYRCSLTPSRCNDICQMIDVNQDGLPDGGRGEFKLYGNANLPGEPLLRTTNLSSGIPWLYDQGAMINADRCNCEMN
jgi:hypothetical protein